MIDYKIIEPIMQIHFNKYFELRWISLRKDWGQEIGTERDPADNNSIHRMIINDNDVAIAVGRLHYNSDKESQIRFMGVHPEYRGAGYGTVILNELEKISYNANRKKIILQARESAINFYLSNGYKLEKKTHLLFNSIQHYSMSKKLVIN